MNIKIREIIPIDCTALAQLDKDIFSEPLSEQGFLNEINNPNSYTVVALHNEMIIGYCNFWGICGEITLNNIAVSVKYQGKGIGKLLLENALGKLNDRYGEYDFITLEVRTSNATAISLYEKYGFEIVGERKNFYKLPTENALLMTKFFKK